LKVDVLPASGIDDRVAGFSRFLQAWLDFPGWFGQTLASFLNLLSSEQHLPNWPNFSFSKAFSGTANRWLGVCPFVSLNSG
jgi:hypothetical protein